MSKSLPVNQVPILHFSFIILLLTLLLLMSSLIMLKIITTTVAITTTEAEIITTAVVTTTTAAEEETPTTTAVAVTMADTAAISQPLLPRMQPNHNRGFILHGRGSLLNLGPLPRALIRPVGGSSHVRQASQTSWVHVHLNLSSLLLNLLMFPLTWNKQCNLYLFIRQTTTTGTWILALHLT